MLDKIEAELKRIYNLNQSFSTFEFMNHCGDIIYRTYISNPNAFNDSIILNDCHEEHANIDDALDRLFSYRNKNQKRIDVKKAEILRLQKEVEEIEGER